MLFQLNREQFDLVKKVVLPGMFVITKHGVSKVLSVDKFRVLTTNENLGDLYYDYSDVVPIMKGFEHLTLIDLYTVADLITDRIGYGNYKPNHNFLPHLYEVTEESIELKIQIYHNFDIIHCDHLLRNIGKAYYYLISKNFDIYNLNKKGLAIIDPQYYGTNEL
jgi:hypothetical protein